MAFYPYYAPYARPMNYYNPSIPQDNQNIQNGQQFQQIPVQQQVPMQTPIQQTPMQPTQMSVTNDMIWVLSEVEAQSYPVAPNNSVILWDKNNDVIYIKSANMQGVPSMRILDYVERTADNAPKTAHNHDCQCGKEFVKVEAFERLQGDFEALRSELDELKAKSKAKATKKVIEGADDNE